MRKISLFCIIILIIVITSFNVYADSDEEILNTGIYYPVKPSEYYEYWLVIDKGNSLVYVGGEAPFTLQGGSIKIYRNIHQPTMQKTCYYMYFYSEGEWRYIESSYSTLVIFESRYHNIVVSNHHIINESDGTIFFYDNYDASPMPTPTPSPSDRDYTGLFGQVIQAIDNLVTGIGDYIINGLQYLFVPSFDFQGNLDNIKDKLSYKFGSVIEIYNTILNNINQIESKQFEGIKIDLSGFVVPIERELYILEPGSINYYAEHLRAWISGIMIFFTIIYFLKKILQIIRGTNPL